MDQAAKRTSFTNISTADELRAAFAGIDRRTMRENVVIVKPTAKGEEFVITVGTDRMAARIAEQIGAEAKPQKHDSSGLTPFQVTEAQFTSPTVLKNTSHSVSITRVGNRGGVEATGSVRQLPDTKVTFSDYRIAIPAGGKLKAELFEQAFGTKVVEAAKANEVVHDMVMRSNNVGVGSR